MEHDDRRIDPRAPAIIKVSYESAGALRTDYAHNISRGGLFVVTDEPFEIGQILELHLTTAGVRRTIPVPGEVRWVGLRGDPPLRGIGVQFLVEDPVVKARIESMVNAVFDPIPPAKAGERVNILIVDPNRHASRMFREGIESMARRVFEVEDYFVVIEVHDGSSALSFLRSSRFSLVLLDLAIPEVDGVELIRRIRTEISQSLPVFAMSRPFPGDRHDALAAGADAFVHKPVQLKALFNTLRMMLKLGSDEAKADAPE